MRKISRRTLMLGAAAVGAAASVGLPRMAAADVGTGEEAISWAARLGGVTLNACEHLECGWSRMHFGEWAFVVSDRFVQATLPCKNGYDILSPGGGRLLLVTRDDDHSRVPLRVVDVLARDHSQSVEKRKEVDLAARRNARWQEYRVDAAGATHIMRCQDDRMLVFLELLRCEGLTDASETVGLLLGESWDGIHVYQVRRGAGYR